MEPRVSLEFGGNFWPAPVNLVSVGVEKPNIFTLGIVGAPCSRPPMVTISPRPHRYSYELLQDHPEFVINFPTVEMIDEMYFCGTKSGRDVDKWEACNFTPIPGKVVDVPLIAECPVNVECTVERELSFKHPDGRDGSHICVIGRIVHLNCHEEYLVDGNVQWDLIDLIFRARPGTWRALGPVIGYDPRKRIPDDPRLEPVRINERTASLASLYEPEQA
jgi:flavin reductase (DIM6/NTAB) family NADH-FMN oxidoreductase RutF